METFLRRAESCTKLLSSLSKTWSVAKNSQEKFDHLVQITKNSWNSNQNSITPEHQTQAGGNTSEPHVQEISNPDVLDSLPEGFWDGLDVDFSVPPNMLIDELGDMSTWFDLDWLGDPNSSF